MKTESKHIIEDDFFDYLADKNINSISDSDMNDLFNRIDLKTKINPTKNASGAFYIILISSFTIILLVCLFNKRTILQIAPQVMIAEELINTKESQSVPLTDSIISFPEENYTTPSIKKAIPDLDNSKNDLLQNSTEDILIDPIRSKTISLTDTSKQIQQREVELLLLPNASVFYLYDLKITEYQKLYFRKLKPFALNIDNISAQFENSDSYSNYVTDLTKENPYTLDMLLKDALKAFNKQQYKQSTLLFNELLIYNPNDPNAHFYGGLSLYHSGNYHAAAVKFDLVLELENNIFHQEAEWYKGLAMLKQNKRDEAVKIFIGVLSKNGFYAKRAEEKLQELK